MLLHCMSLTNTQVFHPGRKCVVKTYDSPDSVVTVPHAQSSISRRLYSYKSAYCHRSFTGITSYLRCASPFLLLNSKVANKLSRWMRNCLYSFVLYMLQLGIFTAFMLYRYTQQNLTYFTVHLVRL